MVCGGCGTTKITLTKPISTPILHSDGVIEFPKDQELPVINGYEPDGQKLIPKDGVECVWRITGIMLQKDGTYKPHHVCRHSKCEYRSQPVDFDICKKCNWREAT